MPSGYLFPVYPRRHGVDFSPQLGEFGIVRPIGENQSLCKRCDQILPLDAFYVANKSSCKSCLQAVGRERYQNKKLATD